MRGWLQQCRAEHSKADCRLSTKPRLPTRILDISQEAPSLVETVDQFDDYAALSHCWGSTEGSMPPKMLLSNLGTHIADGVATESLSQTFKDAITVAKHLGYRYLWVDSLCIIQDDHRDWQYESGRMADVYGNADLVIGATSAVDSSSGFLGLRQGFLQQGAIQLDAPQRQRAWTVCYRTALPHNPWLSNQEAFRPADEGPLETRGWAYQERTMARRYVSFGKSELCWECTAMLDCECCSLQGCGRSPDDAPPEVVRRTVVLPPRKYNLRRKLAQELAPEALRTAWRHNTVEPYSRRQLTRPSDRLAAISASAARFAEKMRCSDRYLAGIWAADLPAAGLCWHTAAPAACAPVGGDRAPSWSWASVSGAITHVRRNKWKLDWAAAPSVVNVDYSAPPENIFGCPSHACITLRGKLLKDVRMQHDPKNVFTLYLPAGKALALFVDVMIEAIEIGAENQIPVRSARRTRQETVGTEQTGEEKGRGCDFGGLYLLSLAEPGAMVLGLVSLHPRQYERLGFCVLNGAQCPWEEAEVSLI